MVQRVKPPFGWGSAARGRCATGSHVGRAGGAWARRPVPLEPGGRATALASDGGRRAVVAYQAPVAGASGPGLRCGLALIDVRTGTVERTHRVCTARDSIVGVALEDGAAGPIAYVALWSRPDVVDGRRVGAGSRVLAVDAERGAVLGTYPLAGVAGSVVLAPAPGRLGYRLYCVE